MFNKIITHVFIVVFLNSAKNNKKLGHISTGGPVDMSHVFLSG